MVHTDKYNYQCPTCGKRLKCRNSMYGHIAQFHAKTLVLYQCQQCGKRFRQKGNLKKHVLTHSDKRTYACKYCTKTFKFPEQIRRHELLHTHGHRFKCDMCDKTFVMEFEKRKHMSTYHGGIVYVCKYCLTDCHHFHTMKRHLARRHFDIPEWQSDTSKFIQSLIKSDESEEYHNIKKEREEHVGLIFSQPGSGGPIEIQTLPAEASQALGQIQIITRPVQGIIDGTAQIVTDDDARQLISNDKVHVITTDVDQATAGDDMEELMDKTADNQAVQSTAGLASQVDHMEQNTVVLVSQPDMESGEGGIGDVNVETPITIDQGSVNIPGIPMADGQGPIIVAEVQGLNPGSQNQTFIIHGSMDNIDPETFMTKEMAEALQSLSNSGALGDDQQKIIQIGDVLCSEDMMPNQTIFVAPGIEDESQLKEDT